MANVPVAQDRAPWWQRLVSDAIESGTDLVRQVDPYVRPVFDGLLRQPVEDTVQWLINARRADEHLGIAEERVPADEAALAQAIADVLVRFTDREYRPGSALRAGNTKTYAVVRAEFTVHDGLADPLRHGVFARARTFPAWVRFAGPGPLAPPDIRDNGILSIGIKLMDVEGDKLLDDEQFTQDFTGLTAPTTVTSTLADNLEYRRHVYAGSPLRYFLNPLAPRLLDMAMQALYARTHTSPLEARYWSCVPYLLGPGQAMKYAITPVRPGRSRVPWNPPDDYLQQATIRTLAHRDALFDFAIQRQTDPHRMPIEDASVVWPERLSPFITVATLRIPQQNIDPRQQFQLADRLSYNPWHCLPAHRPLGNQNRARHAIYQQLSHHRQTMNGAKHEEPVPDEQFELRSPR